MSHYLTLSLVSQSLLVLICATFSYRPHLCHISSSSSLVSRDTILHHPRSCHNSSSSSRVSQFLTIHNCVTTPRHLHVYHNSSPSSRVLQFLTIFTCVTIPCRPCLCHNFLSSSFVSQNLAVFLVIFICLTICHVTPCLFCSRAHRDNQLQSPQGGIFRFVQRIISSLLCRTAHPSEHRIEPRSEQLHLVGAHPLSWITSLLSRLCLAPVVREEIRRLPEESQVVDSLPALTSTNERLRDDNSSKLIHQRDVD